MRCWRWRLTAQCGQRVDDRSGAVERLDDHLRSPDCAGAHQHVAHVVITTNGWPRRRGEDCELHVERTLDYPDSCNQNNQRRAAEENNLSIERRPAKEERDRQERADYHQLPGLNAEVETDERERERTLRQAELLQDIREAQAVDEPE